MPGILLHHFLEQGSPTALGILLGLFDTRLLHLSPELQEDKITRQGSHLLLRSLLHPGTGAMV